MLKHSSCILQFFTLLSIMMNVGLLAALVTLDFYEGRSFRLLIFGGGLISRALKIALKIYRADLFEAV